MYKISRASELTPFQKKRAIRCRESYITIIKKVSVGIFLDDNGYNIVVVGLEEIRNTGYARSRRFWLLKEILEHKAPGLNSLYHQILKINENIHIDAINTNLNICKNILENFRYVQVLEIEEKAVLLLIKSLLSEHQLLIPNNIEYHYKPLLANCNMERDYGFINALYLALNFNIDKVITSSVFDHFVFNTPNEVHPDTSLPYLDE